MNIEYANVDQSSVTVYRLTRRKRKPCKLLSTPLALQLRNCFEVTTPPKHGVEHTSDGL
jgi:hypothetical protein